MGKPYDPATDQLAFHGEFDEFHTIEARPAGTPDQVLPLYPYTATFGNTKVRYYADGTVDIWGLASFTDANGGIWESIFTWPFSITNPSQISVQLTDTQGGAASPVGAAPISNIAENVYGISLGLTSSTELIGVRRQATPPFDPVAPYGVYVYVTGAIPA
uniref:Uncharacterized protein n=1 Tax=uncultured Thiotrichaceae bacterium TaxID=298394 RepID=A0A6S6UI87_9GAMM|nr:MAG: Unknown protein [uncultured Thiotrichaceae bacterium]